MERVSQLVCEKMARLHRLGITHNDLHPGNVMVQMFVITKESKQ